MIEHTFKDRAFEALARAEAWESKIDSALREALGAAGGELHHDDVARALRAVCDDIGEDEASDAAERIGATWVRGVLVAADPHVRGDYGSCAEIPMLDDERQRADAMAREMCADSSCDTKALLLARRVVDLLAISLPEDSCDECGSAKDRFHEPNCYRSRDADAS